MKKTSTNCIFLGILGLLLLWGSSAPGFAQEPLKLKTLSRAPMAEFDRYFSWDNSRINLSLNGRSWLEFSHDGRRVFPYPDLWLCDLSIFDSPEGKGGDNLKKILTFLFMKPSGDAGAQVFNLNTLVSYQQSQDGAHWAAVVQDRKNRNLFLVYMDGKEIYQVDSSWEKDAPPIFNLIFSPDGEHVAFMVNKKKGLLRKGISYLVLDGKEMAPVPDGFFISRSLAFSPDGRHLACFVSSGSGFKPQADLVYDGEVIDSKRYKNEPDAWLRASFSPDGRYLAYDCLGSYWVKKQTDRIFDLKERKVFLDGDIVNYGFNGDSSGFFHVQQAPSKLYKVTTNSGAKFYSKVGDIKFSPDGKRLAYAAESQGKWVVVLDGQEKIAGPEAENLQFSPDGKRLAYAAKTDAKKWKIVADELEWGPYDKVQKPLESSHAIYYPERAVFFSPDGSRIAYSAVAGKTSSLYVDGVAQCSFAKIGVPLFSPDGGRLACWASDGDQEFVVLDGKPLAKFDEVDPWQLIFSPDGKHIAYKAKKNKKWFVVVDGTPSENLFDQIVTAHAGRMGIVFAAPDKFYYVGLKKDLLTLVDERIE